MNSSKPIELVHASYPQPLLESETMSDWEEEFEPNSQELEEMKSLEPVKLYADEDVSSALIAKINGYGFSIKSARKSGYYKREDDFHIEVANREERCLIAQDKDYLATQQHLRKQIQYGLIVVEGDFSSKYDLDSVASNCFIVLSWGKEFLKHAVFKITPDSFIGEYLNDSGNPSKREWRYVDGKLKSRKLL